MSYLSREIIGGERGIRTRREGESDQHVIDNIEQ